MVRYAVAYCDKDHPDNFMVDYGPAEGFATPCVALDQAEAMRQDGKYQDVTPFAYREGAILNWDYAIHHEMEYSVAYQRTDASGCVTINIQTHLKTMQDLNAAVEKIAKDFRVYRPFVRLILKERHTLHQWCQVVNRDVSHVPERLLN